MSTISSLISGSSSSSFVEKKKENRGIASLSLNFSSLSSLNRGNSDLSKVEKRIIQLIPTPSSLDSGPVGEFFDKIQIPDFDVRGLSAYFSKEEVEYLQELIEECLLGNRITLADLLGLKLFELLNTIFTNPLLKAKKEELMQEWGAGYFIAILGIFRDLESDKSGKPFKPSEYTWTGPFPLPEEPAKRFFTLPHAFPDYINKFTKKLQVAPIEGVQGLLSKKLSKTSIQAFNTTLKAGMDEWKKVTSLLQKIIEGDQGCLLLVDMSLHSFGAAPNILKQTDLGAVEKYLSGLQTYLQWVQFLHSSAVTSGVIGISLSSFSRLSEGLGKIQTYVIQQHQLNNRDCLNLFRIINEELKALELLTRRFYEEFVFAVQGKLIQSDLKDVKIITQKDQKTFTEQRISSFLVVRLACSWCIDALRIFEKACQLINIRQFTHVELYLERVIYMARRYVENVDLKSLKQVSQDLTTPFASLQEQIILCLKPLQVHFLSLENAASNLVTQSLSMFEQVGQVEVFHVLMEIEGVRAAITPLSADFGPILKEVKVKVVEVIEGFLKQQDSELVRQQFGIWKEELRAFIRKNTLLLNGFFLLAYDVSIILREKLGDAELPDYLPDSFMSLLSLEGMDDFFSFEEPDRASDKKIEVGEAFTSGPPQEKKSHQKKNSKENQEKIEPLGNSYSIDRRTQTVDPKELLKKAGEKTRLLIACLKELGLKELGMTGDHLKMGFSGNAQVIVPDKSTQKLGTLKNIHKQALKALEKKQDNKK